MIIESIYNDYEKINIDGIDILIINNNINNNINNYYKINIILNSNRDIEHEYTNKKHFIYINNNKYISIDTFKNDVKKYLDIKIHNKKTNIYHKVIRVYQLPEYH